MSERSKNRDKEIEIGISAIECREITMCLENEVKAEAVSEFKTR